MKIIHSLFLIIFLSVNGFAQKMIATPIGQPQIVYSENGIIVSSQLTECQNLDRDEKMTYNILTLTNNNNVPATLKMRQDSYYNDKCYTCENDEYTFTFNLGASESKQGSCYGDTNPALSVFHSMKDGYYKEVLTDLKMNIVRLN
ncbi:MAG: hypothetical protein FJZ80_01860 [Bacteroidetes bacterium]|nr:hypothetical protein [Bacteroidota bacterium]MBM3425211.1 hypothetical protein [Bacteroidota bacterium]